MEENSFDSDLIHALFKSVWKRKAQERERNEGDIAVDGEVVARVNGVRTDGISWHLFYFQKLSWIIEDVGAGISKKSRPMSANANALKLSCELLRIFITEAVQRGAIIAEAEGISQIEATHLERILPQLLLDF